MSKGLDARLAAHNAACKMLRLSQSPKYLRLGNEAGYSRAREALWDIVEAVDLVELLTEELDDE